MIQKPEMSVKEQALRLKDLIHRDLEAAANSVAKPEYDQSRTQARDFSLLERKQPERSGLSMKPRAAEARLEVPIQAQPRPEESKRSEVGQSNSPVLVIEMGIAESAATEQGVRRPAADATGKLGLEIEFRFSFAGQERVISRRIAC